MAVWPVALQVEHRALSCRVALALCLATIGFAAPSSASEYDCHNLVRVAGQPLVEGTKGFFFRTVPDLSEHFPLSDRTAGLMKALSSALAARGTQLIYVPIPTKGSVSGPFLPTSGIAGMFDQRIALRSYSDFVATLTAAGVIAVDVASAIDAKPGEAPTFLGADHHWTSDGARRAAKAVAAVMAPLPDYQKLAKGTYQSVSIGPAKIASSMRRSIQAACRSPLPVNETEGFETRLGGETSGEQSMDLFGEAAGAGRIALAGTSFSDIEVINFGGFVSELTGLDVTNFAISGGNQFVSILSYLTSQQFADDPPDFLIWENPIYNNIGEFGDAPLLELIAAASGACAPGGGIAEQVQLESGTARIDLTALPKSGGDLHFIAIDAHDPSVKSVSAILTYDDGSEAIHNISRHERFTASGRFFVPLPNDLTGVKSASVRNAGALPGGTTIKLCSYPLTEG